MRGFFCNGFINFMLKGKSLLDYTNLFSTNDCEKINNTKILFYSITKWMKKSYCIICGKFRKFKKPKMS